jgi:hypothetical protein
LSFLATGKDGDGSALSTSSYASTKILSDSLSRN